MNAGKSPRQAKAVWFLCLASLLSAGRVAAQAPPDDPETPPLPAPVHEQLAPPAVPAMQPPPSPAAQRGTTPAVPTASRPARGLLRRQGTLRPNRGRRGPVRDRIRSLFRRGK
jgi:hypothetical protein